MGLKAVLPKLSVMVPLLLPCIHMKTKRINAP